jgi:hypothetical protein
LTSCHCLQLGAGFERQLCPMASKYAVYSPAETSQPDSSYSIYSATEVRASNDEPAADSKRAQDLTRADSSLLTAASVSSLAADFGSEQKQLEFRKAALARNDLNESFLTALSLPESNSDEVLLKYQASTISSSMIFTLSLRN